MKRTVITITPKRQSPWLRTVWHETSVLPPELQAAKDWLLQHSEKQREKQPQR